MKPATKFVSVLIMLSIIACISWSVNAVSSTLYVSAGSSAYSSETDETSGYHSLCHMALTYVHFNNYPENSIPSSYYVYARLYRTYPLTAASNNASFSQVNSNGYDYSYLSGFGLDGQKFIIKSNSNLNIYYSATFYWYANA